MSEQQEQDEEMLQCLRDSGIEASNMDEVQLKRKEGLLSGEQQADNIRCLSETG